MEEEAECSGNGDEGLLKLLGNSIPNDALYIRADFRVIILPELGGARLNQEANSTDGDKQQKL
ncbi:hypothetical protein IEQ34_004544 [Dendrobium chrysotoxum]|uniref:Uncharacterized protein n=1 Tax=Dendrobium chrysotoxum TaxID=161865 RepID=A0AAV7HEB0_DENCH|nr:hypothetical protein IEQ34_004544 [Dendrobium chrysotoxum]